ncbi:hypothetical protein DNHGIG_25470 [Collibacillus ludicampi]|uniref:Uncharacterized protein n=1 Tax=Collibacillus ludicampi TaxID=2771369 RepID=A0AAV4LH11_9BACL|nr:hypothetical protein [Collibacillus ludicampi]GIM46998.1 hypothetical protein DNHGIG_25470 [Collibacillus ludicampi]
MNRIYKSDDQRLVEITSEHSRLSAEYGARGTTSERKEEILVRINELRAERSAILQKQAAYKADGQAWKEV